MLFRVLADITVLLHLAFIVFAVLGGVLCIWWRKVMWLHVPVVLWAALIEFVGNITCPLTPLENWLRIRGGQAGYAGGFVDHYILPAIYPTALTRQIELLLGAFVVAVNLVLYWHVFRRHKSKAL